MLIQKKFVTLQTKRSTMMNNSNYIKIQNGKVDASLDVVVYHKDGIVYAYAPALDLVGYDYTEDGAKKSFEIVFYEYIKFAVENKTLEADLSQHGWKEKRKEQFSALDFIGLLNQNKQLQDVVYNNYSKVSEQLSFCVC